MQKNKVLLINPPQTCPLNAKYSSFKFPLGLIYLAGSLEREGFKVKIIDSPLYYKKKRKINDTQIKVGLFPEDIKKILLDFKPDIVGVPCAYSAYESDSFDVIDLVKEVSKNILVIVGGAHTSANTEYVLRNRKIDLAVIGEGEETIVEIAKNYKKKNIKNIKGTALMHKGKFKKNNPREFIQDLDKLKPAWNLLNMKLYFEHPDNSTATLRKPSVDIITSRGCPGNCSFCSVHTVWGRKWRGKSAKKVVDEIEFLVKTYGARQFRIQDDNLTLNKKRGLEIFEEIMKRKLNIKWDTPNGVAFWALDEELLKKMQKSGCYRITFGIESGCKNTQKYVRKLVDLNKIRRLINTCHKLKMWICSTFIIGFPYEKKKDIDESKKFIVDSKINFPFLYVAQPYQGTDMYNDFKKEKLLNDFEFASNIGDSKYNTKYLTHEFLNQKRHEIFKIFYLKTILRYTNPIIFYKEFLSKIRNLEELKYISKNFKNIFIGS